MSVKLSPGEVNTDQFNMVTGSITLSAFSCQLCFSFLHFFFYQQLYTLSPVVSSTHSNTLYVACCRVQTLPWLSHFNEGYFSGSLVLAHLPVSAHLSRCPLPITWLSLFVYPLLLIPQHLPHPSPSRTLGAPASRQLITWPKPDELSFVVKFPNNCIRSSGSSKMPSPAFLFFHPPHLPTP